MLNDLVAENIALKNLLEASHSEIEKRDSEIEKQKSLIQGLHELIAHLRRKAFGASSEKVSSEQLGMFNEVEAEALNPEPEDEDEEEGAEGGGQKKPKKKRGKRAPLPEALPRVEVIIDIEDKICPEDGSELKCIGEEISEKLEIISPQVRVIRTIRKKYACPACETVSEAPAPADLIPKSNATSSVLAYIATAKYADALPLYRQEEIFKRIGVDFPRQTMARWMIKAGEAVAPLITLLREEMLKSHYLFMDETVVQVLREDGKKAQTKSYMWVQGRAGPSPILLFHYAKDRSGSHAQELLDDFGGALHVDGYDGYARVIANNRILRLGCWAHARRKFHDAFKSSAGSSVGKQGLVFFKKLAEIEDEIENSSLENRFYVRLTRSVPIAKELKAWIDVQRSKVTPESLAGKALGYAHNEWEYLMNCLSHGEFRMDNNWIESHIRPFTIGRKNWMFSVTPEGAMASANLYSLIETAKANGLDAYEYLNKVFTKLPLAQTEKDFLDLLPVKM